MSSLTTTTINTGSGTTDLTMMTGNSSASAIVLATNGTIKLKANSTLNAISISTTSITTNTATFVANGNFTASGNIGGVNIVASGNVTTGGTISANGGVGTADYLLTSGATTNAYWSSVGSAISGQVAGDLGTYIWGLPNNTTAYNIGDPIAGSLLLPTGAQNNDGAPATSRTSGTGTALSGTWQCMGTRTLASGSLSYNATLWLRIA